MTDLSAALDRLATLRQTLATLPAVRLQALERALGPEIYAGILALEQAHAESTKDLEYAIGCVEAEIKGAVLEAGVTAMGPILSAVWCEGRVTWKNREMATYATLHPEVLAYRTQGQPYVLIRATNGHRPEP
jgi:hypothetical protein